MVGERDFLEAQVSERGPEVDRIRPVANVRLEVEDLEQAPWDDRDRSGARAELRRPCFE